MANFHSNILANAAASPRVKNEVEFNGGRIRTKVARFGTAATSWVVDAAQNDVLFLAEFHLGDTVYKAELTNAALGVGVLGNLGLYRKLVATGDTAVLAPISGGTSTDDRFALGVDMNSARTFDAPVNIWGEGGGTGTPIVWGPIYEQLGYDSLADALADISDGVVQAGLLLEGADPANAVVAVRFEYNAGD